MDDLVPADVRDLEPRKGKSRYAPRQQTETSGVALFPALEEQLQADADAKKRLRPRRLDDRLARTARAELARTIGQRALPRHDDSFGGQNRLRIGGDPHLGAGGDVLERLRHRAQVAHAVIHNGDLQRVPLVEGTMPAARGSGSAAMRSARANALNMVSHWWWALSPRRLSMCSVTCAWLTKPWKNSCTRSTSNSPISARVNLTWYSSPGRPEKSSTTRESASSRGT